MFSNLAKFAVAACVLVQTSSSLAQDLPTQINAQAEASINLMLANISRPDTAPGSVVASPSKANPDYYFFWVRDAAITMNTIGLLYANSSGPKQQEYLRILTEYVTFSRHLQVTPNRSGGLGEPKWMADGTPDNEEWGRPQNDGPALRALTLTRLANLLLKQGQTNYVKQALYDGQLPTQSVIKADLEYVAHNWQNPCVDLWEEIGGYHFYTLIVQRAALIAGSKLANQLQDDAAALYYKEQATHIEQFLGQFWNPSGGYISETIHQTYGFQKSGLDVAVILGVLHGNTGDGFLSPGNDAVLSTAYRLMSSFQQIYKVNTLKGMVPAIGRYPEDTYNGSGESEGNPWFIATLAYAQLCYEVSRDFARLDNIKITNLNVAFLSFAINDGNTLKEGMTLSKDNPLFAKVISGLKNRGDDFFVRVLYHNGGADNNLTEQFNRYSGYKQGADNLTWSHAAFIDATAWRSFANRP